jgi:uncharacterized protein (UPF0332 family)
MDWKECLNKKIAKRIKEDIELINSLIKTSENKLASENKLLMENVTADSKISLAYDSLRELLEALAIKAGYKIYNHEGYTPFLKEIIKEIGIGEEFDEVRKIRNLINYYGKSVTVDEAGKIIEKIKLLRKQVEQLLAR